MNCGTCAHWSLTGDMAKHGYGQCLAREEPYRSGMTTAAQNVCRIEKYQKAKPAELRQRENAGGTLL